jgi:cell division protein FtsZ
MNDEIINFGLQQAGSSIIKVIGVGGGGNNAVNHMFGAGIEGVDFIICNTDSQAMLKSPVPVKVQLGVTLTEGRGAGNHPAQGEQAAIENLDDLKLVIEGSTKMLFITAGFGGGTGTGAAPVIAKLARELNILTIAVVTIPSPAEGKRRFNQALEGVKKLEEHVDSLLVVSNEKLHKIYGDLPASQAFKKADDIIATAVKGVAEIITLHGNINIDFADVSTVLTSSGVFLMGTGFADGENRDMKAVKAALDSPLLDSNDINGTKDILLNIISGENEITMGEIGNIIEYLQEAAGQDANIIWGNGFDNRLGKQISVSIIATGFNTNPNELFQEEKPIEEFELNNVETNINIEEEEIEEQLFESEKSKEQEVISDKQTEKKKKELISENVQESGNTDNWFHRKFTRFFEDNDVSISDE